MLFWASAYVCSVAAFLKRPLLRYGLLEFAPKNTQFEQHAFSPFFGCTKTADTLAHFSSCDNYVYTRYSFIKTDLRRIARKMCSKNVHKGSFRAEKNN